MLWYEKQDIAGRQAFKFGMNNFDRRLIVKEFFSVKALILLIRTFRRLLFPNRNHTVKSLRFNNRLIFAFLTLNRHTLVHIHFYRIAQIVGVFFDKCANTVFIKKLAVILVFRILLDVKRNYRTAAVFLSFSYCVSVNAG